MAWVMAAVSFAGSAQTSMSERKAGLAARTDARVEAAQMERNAGQVRAYSTRAGNEERRQARLAASRAQAVGAKQGGGMDGDVERAIAGIEGEGEYRALLAMHQGDTRARGLEFEADVTRRGGGRAYSAAKRQALATTLKGAESAYSKYGSGSYSSSLDSTGSYG